MKKKIQALKNRLIEDIEKMILTYIKRKIPKSSDLYGKILNAEFLRKIWETMI